MYKKWRPDIVFDQEMDDKRVDWNKHLMTIYVLRIGAKFSYGSCLTRRTEMQHIDAPDIVVQKEIDDKRVDWNKTFNDNISAINMREFLLCSYKTIQTDKKL